MPDWSYHGIFKPLLKRLPPTMSREFIHRGMNIIASLPLNIGAHLINFLGREESSPLIGKEIHGIHFPNSVGLSGKIDPLLSGTKAFTNLGFGFIEIGPVTMERSEAFTNPIVDHENKKILFPMQAESIGLEQTYQKLVKLKKKQPIFIRIVGTAEEVRTMVEKLDEVADGFIFEEKFLEIIEGIHKPVFLATSDTDGLDEHPFAGIILEQDDTGTSLLEKISRLRKNGYAETIITSGGIIEPEHALAILDAGADLVMLSDGYVFSGPGLPKRIHEALVDRLQYTPPPPDGWFHYWLFGLFIMIGGIFAFIFSITTVILPYDEFFLKMKREEIWNFNERIMLFMAHDRMTLAGTMISGGIVYMQLARHGVKRGLRWAKEAIDIAAIIGFLGIFAFIGFGYFDWLHLLFWLILLPVYIVGFRKTKGIRGTPSSKNRWNDSVFRKGIYGQLLMVILGFSFVLGGIVISVIGMTSIFVQTDLQYLCMPPEVMAQFNENLLPVIAHDRAGFGSALLSVGLLVLTLSLWGFQQGQRWMWWTYLIGGLPAFYAGIYIHFAIGYTTFIHLLPAYFALALFLIGLVLSFRFFR